MAEYKSAEDYADPATYGAFCAIEEGGRAFRTIVYICSPYAGDVEGNTAAARRYSRFAVETEYIPIAPHLLYPQFLDDNDPKERELGIFFGNAIMSMCSEVWVFGSVVSDGMRREIERATKKHLTIRYFMDDCSPARIHEESTHRREGD